MMRRNKVFVFDLDDTLYKEIDFLKSAYREICFFLESQFELTEIFNEMLGYYYQGRDAFQEIINAHRIPVDKITLLKMYREHKPYICLDEDTAQTLRALYDDPLIKIGIITDGRYVSQTNKINALGLKTFMGEEDVFISETHGHQKPDEYAFRMLEERYKGCEFTYIGDNPLKDFLAPNRLGWGTVCLLDDGRNIHKQDFDLPKEYLPQNKIAAMSDIIKKLAITA